MAETKPPSAAVCGSSNSIYELCSAVHLFIVMDIKTAPAHWPCTFLSSFRLPAADFPPVPFPFLSFVLSLNFCVSAQLMESYRKMHKGRQAGARTQRPQKLEAIEKKRWKCTQHLPGELVFLLIFPLLSLSVRLIHSTEPVTLPSVLIRRSVFYTSRLDLQPALSPRGL